MLLFGLLYGNNQLPQKSIDLIKNLNNKCYLSIASIWEIAIKLSLGKLTLNGGFDNISHLMNQFEIEILPLIFEHLQKLLKLEFYHRDPFDRIIILQGILENLFIVTKDENFRKYDIKIVWN